MLSRFEREGPIVMTAGAITTDDLRALRGLLDLSDPMRQPGSVESTWESVLSTVKSLVACDAVTFCIQDVAGLHLVSILELSDRYQADTELDGAWDEQWFDNFSATQFNYPHRSGDYFTVTKTTDFEAGGALCGAAGCSVTPADARNRAARVMLPLLGSLDYRVLLWRDGACDFSERDMVLLALLRPTLVAIRDATFRPAPSRPELTPRQLQLLGLVATGLTNRQTARQMGVSEHTVRKHVENIFERLQVSSRTAAVNRVFAGNSSG